MIVVIYIYGPPPKREPYKPAESTSTEVPRNTYSPAPNQPWVPRPDLVPRPCFPQTPHTELSMDMTKVILKLPWNQGFVLHDLLNLSYKKTQYTVTVL
jgi:hypothetical protein